MATLALEISIVRSHDHCPGFGRTALPINLDLFGWGAVVSALAATTSRAPQTRYVNGSYGLLHAIWS